MPQNRGRSNDANNTTPSSPPPIRDGRPAPACIAGGRHAATRANYARAALRPAMRPNTAPDMRPVPSG